MRVHFEGRTYDVEGNYEPADVSTDADGRVAERYPAGFEIVSVALRIETSEAIVRLTVEDDLADNPAFIEACVEAYEEERVRLNDGPDDDRDR